MLYRCIKPKWNTSNFPNVVEGQFSPEKVLELNANYNCYFLPNYPSHYDSSVTVTGDQVDKFNYVFVDFDLKSGTYESKEAFLLKVLELEKAPTRIIDSGNGIHAYWKVSDLEPMSYLRLQRRLMRLLRTDEAVGQIFQLMRVPGTLNIKDQNKFKECFIMDENDSTYTCEELDTALPPITHNDELYCQQHYNKTYKIAKPIRIDDRIPAKFNILLKNNNEVRDIWQGNTDDRSKADFRLGAIMHGHNFTRAEALSVLVNAPKAVERAPVHRVSYAEGIVEKIWPPQVPANESSPTVRSLLSRGEEFVTGTRFPCHRLIDDTVHGFRLSQVIGIIGGSGVGKTTLTLNAFLWFAANNPTHHHFFFSLEQPAGEIANRIRTICQGNENLFDMIHIVSNYADDGTFKNLSMEAIETHLLEFMADTGDHVGACVVDHIGVLAKSDKHGESEGLIGICKKMKAVAVKVNMMLIMLSQAPREKAGIGDLELNKDAAFGTVFFESFVDYCICLWQPLKRMYAEGAPTTMAFKFAKIRHKKQGEDAIKEDVRYQVHFDPKTELLRELTEVEETSAAYFLKRATTERGLDRKTDLLTYDSRRVDGKADNN